MLTRRVGLRRRLPLRARLAAAFAAVMLVVLTGTSGFVYWRVRYALDLRLNEDLTQQAGELSRAIAAHPGDPGAALTSVAGTGRTNQVVGADGTVLASSQASRSTPLVPPARLEQARADTVRFELGGLFSARGDHLRVTAFPLGPGGAQVGVSAVVLDQRDEALRELMVQLAVADLLALVAAAAVGYRLAHAALAPVERYRAQAEQITAGATGVRLDVPDGTDDEVTRLGHTLNTMLAAQEEAAARQRQFVADASHELRTPLTLLTSEVEIALRRPRSLAELEETLRAVAGDTQRLVMLADTLLSFESADDAARRESDVDVAEALQGAARTARAVLPEDSLRLITTTAGPGLHVRADQIALARMLSNLAENAARHGRGDIVLTAEATGHALVITVHDQGTIPAEFLSEAAERFRRADTARTTPGSGLGLALVDALARAHEGQLRICSEGNHHARPSANAALAALPCTHPSAGTSVSLLLPLD